jgi:predicted ATP-dependent endonuclease of OLD family
MLLKIKGIGKIQDSTIEMKGITVIAGENNTGKSTYGKVLYCMFNAFQNTKAAIHDERLNDIRRIVYNFSSNKYRPYIAEQLFRKIIREIDHLNSGEFSEGDIQKIIMYIISEQSLFKTDKEESVANDLIESIKLSMIIDDNEIQKTVVNRYFTDEFEGQVNHVNRPRSTGNISLVIQGKNIDVFIESNECKKFIDNVGIRHNAIYMDTPFVMDDISRHYRRILPYPRSSTNSNYQTNHRKSLHYRLSKEHSDNTVIEEVIINQKITNILSNIHSVTKGEFKRDKENLMFLENGLKKPVPLSNVSAGIKAFLVIKRLLELGEIKERNILILDEPEIHLHPAWQLQFAEILVLLQKEFNLTILLATHSPYFLNAIEVYGEKYNIKEYINFYLTENQGDISTIQDVTNNLDTIYKLLAGPFQKLEDTKYED